MILNKQFFKKKANNLQQTPEKSHSTEFDKVKSSEKLTPNKITPQKPQEGKITVNTAATSNSNITRALSPNINTSINSAGKIKSQNAQAKVNTGSAKKKIKTSPMVLETIVNEVVNKHAENQNIHYEEDMNKINECVYLTKVCNQEEEKKKEGLVNDSFGEKDEKAEQYDIYIILIIFSPPPPISLCSKK